MKSGRWNASAAPARDHLEGKPFDWRVSKCTYWVACLGFFGVLVGGCSEQAIEPPPDMEQIRGEPIEKLELGNQEMGLNSTGSEEEEWLETEAELLMVGFDRLAGFEYVEAEPGSADRSTDQIPREIRALDGREVGVRGFMLPIRMDGGLVREFLLMRDQSMCCFGVIPRINEWVAVTMSGRGVRAMMDQPVTVFGTLRVGEVYEHGVLGGIYRMEGEELAGALDL